MKKFKISYIFVKKEHSILRFLFLSPKFKERCEQMFIIDCIMLVLLIIGGINWGSIGIFQFDIVGFLFGGQGAIVSRIVFCLVAIAAIWCISFLFREHSPLDRPKHRDHDTKHTDVGVPHHR